MEINPSLNLSNEILPIVPQRWHYRLAEWISRLFSPPLVATVALAAIALADFSRAALAWAFLTLLLMILTPAGYLVYLHQRGQITDLDVYVRHQRTRPYLLSIGCSLVTFALLNTANAPYLLQIVAAAAIFQTSGLFAVNLKWKISAHTAATAGFSSLFFLGWRYFRLACLAFHPCCRVVTGALEAPYPLPDDCRQPLGGDQFYAGILAVAVVGRLTSHLSR
ncbi:hypothetical protein [Bellilinea sp.]|uniref:hypothetical protein n=1 Tax=Bellilinea sp. TaxID=2838785 RepID=UPI002ADE35A3|nr:hypothetical protein [Bellilinea sp.]